MAGQPFRVSVETPHTAPRGYQDPATQCRDHAEVPLRQPNLAHRLTPGAQAVFVEVARAASLDPALAQRAAAAVALYEQPVARAAWQVPILAGARRNRVVGITLGLDVYFDHPHRLHDWPLIAHEVAHVMQFLRRGVPWFLVRYGAAYAAGRARGLSDRQAYLDLPDEVEARQVEHAARSRPAPPVITG